MYRLDYNEEQLLQLLLDHDKSMVSRNLPVYHPISQVRSFLEVKISIISNDINNKIELLISNALWT